MISLDDAGATSEVVGSKAAELARARRAGLPVLAGIVLPVDAAGRAFSIGAAALLTGGSGAARLAVMSFPLDERLRQELSRAARKLGPSLVARSSSPCEGDGTWAGAFVSYVGVKPDELSVAVRGCWASAFSPDVLGRCEAQGIDPATLQMAVLVQPEANFEAGGTARVYDDGTVGLAATRGSAAALMAGWGSGISAIVRPDNRVDGLGTEAIGNDRLLAIAALARRVREQLDDDIIEWGWTASGPLLLQCRRFAASLEPSVVSARRAVDGFDSPSAIRAARLIARFPGPLGDELVLPWAILVDELDRLSNVSPAAVDPRTVAAEVRSLARMLVSAVWSASPERARETADRMLASLRDGSPPDVCAQPKPLSAAAIGLARLLLALVRGSGRYLVERGMLSDEDQIWGVATLAQLESSLNQGGAKPILSSLNQRDRWEPFLHAVVVASGSHFRARPASPGVGAGVACFLASPAVPRPATRRPVIVVRRPFPGFAPLLWNAAGLVVTAPVLGAHLIEVANALRVPAVVGCSIEDIFDGGACGPLLAVEGDQGTVAMLPV